MFWKVVRSLTLPSFFLIFYLKLSFFPFLSLPSSLFCLVILLSLFLSNCVFFLPLNFHYPFFSLFLFLLRYIFPFFTKPRSVHSFIIIFDSSHLPFLLFFSYLFVYFFLLHCLFHFIPFIHFYLRPSILPLPHLLLFPLRYFLSLFCYVSYISYM